MFINPNVINAIEPPIAEAQSWISGRSFPEEKPLINLAQAVPSYPPAQSLQEHLATRTRLFQTAQYTEIAGIPELRSSLSTHMNKVYKGNTSLNNVLISSGCNQAYCLTSMTLAKAGDEIIALLDSLNIFNFSSALSRLIVTSEVRLLINIFFFLILLF